MKILIVDDSKAMRMIVRRTLRQAGYGNATVVEAANGAEGLAKAREEKPDLILCDWNMPEMPGIDFLIEFRKTGGKTPFGFVTTEATPERRRSAAGAGAQFLLAKPFTPVALQQAVKACLK